MHSCEFLAVLYTDGGEAAALSVAERHLPASVARLRLDGGGLLLCRWDRAAVPAAGAIVTIDGAGGAPDVPLPRALIDPAGAPASLLAAARQHCSHLWLEDGRLTCWTDHLGLARIYSARAGDCLLLSDSAALLAGADPAPDPAAVSSFLVNGFLVRGRTLFAGVASLPLASISRVSHREIASVPYWRHRPGSDIRADRRETGHELWARVTAAVLARAEDRHTVLALSGGHDSAALLGILHGAGRPVSTFSYTFGAPRPGSDADVARRRTALLGIDHRIYRLDKDFDVAGMLRAHIKSGLILRRPCYEVELLQRVIEETAAHHPGAVMMFGDEAFGQSTFRIRSDLDLLGSAVLKSPGILSRLAPYLPAGPAGRMGTVLWEDYEKILAMPRMDEDEDTKDMLFLDTYLRANMVEMRRQTVSRRHPIGLPHLDLAVIDMARHIPPSLRTEKLFFDTLVQRNLPALFRIRRARNAQSQPVIAAEMRRQRQSLADVIGGLRRGVPGVLAPEALAATLAGLCEAPPAPRKPVYAALQKIVRQGLVPPAVLDAVKRRYYSVYEGGADASGLLLRALHLAMTFDSLGGGPV